MSFVSIKKNLYLILVLLIVLESCVFSNCSKNHLSKDEKKWFKAYNINDTIVFQSNKLNLDTFIVKNKRQSFTPCNKIELGNFQENFFFIELVSILKDSNKKASIYFEFKKTDKRAKCRKYFSVLDLYSDDEIEIIQKIKSIPHPLETFKFEAGINGKKLGYGTIRSFNWNKEKGLLRYTTFKGEVYDLIKKIR